MIIRDTPFDLNNYFMAEDDIAFDLQQAGVKPVYMDADVLYFKKSNKLKKVLKRLGYSELLDNDN